MGEIRKHDGLCPRCGTAERLSRQPYCRPCKQAHAREHRAANKEHYAVRDRYARMKWLYGLDREAVDTLFADPSCAICGSLEMPVVDHDHSTNLVRSILCHRCNSGIGLLDEEPSKLRAAATYIEEWSDRHHAALR